LVCKFLLVSYSITGLSQCVNLPDEYVLVDAEDYKRLEYITFKTMNCLIHEPTSFSDDEAAAATAFSIIWLSGTPDYTVNVETDNAWFLEDNSDLFYPYVLCLALVEKDFPNYTQIQKESEALFMLSQYEENCKGKVECKSLKKIAKLYKRGKLELQLEKSRSKK